MSETRTTGAAQPKPPMALLAELTHRCPLSCPYCSNPTELTGRKAELTVEQWADVFRQAAELGVLQVHISGGEPASRRDLAEITKAAVDAGLYTNLITSGVGLTRKRLDALDAVGLDHVQLSIRGWTQRRPTRLAAIAAVSIARWRWPRGSARSVFR